MGAIGDYVHRTALGYRELGTGKDSPGSFYSYGVQTQYVLSKARKLKVGTKKMRKDLEKLITGMIKPVKKNQDASNRIKQRVEELMVEEFGSTLQNIDFNTLSISQKPGTGGVSKSFINRDAREVIKAKEIVDKLYLTIANKLQKGEVEGKILTEVTALQNEYKKVLDKYVRQLGDTTINDQVLKEIIKFSSQEHKDLINLRNRLTELVQAYAALPAINLQKGQLFEHFLYEIPEVAETVAGKALTKGIIKGMDREFVKFDGNAFDQDLVVKSNLKFLNGNVNIESHRTAQGKVDVQLMWGDQPLNISAKNYNLQNRWVHILSGSSLMYMLQTENSKNEFVNHLLNLNATHSDNDRFLSGQREQILNELKLTLFYKALSGDNTGRQVANLFIINDSSSGEVKVFSIAQLVENLSTRFNLFSVTANGKNIIQMSRFQNRSIDNTDMTPIENSQIRISNLLNQIHSYKINAAIQSAVFK